MFLFQLIAFASSAAAGITPEWVFDELSSTITMTGNGAVYNGTSLNSFPWKEKTNTASVIIESGITGLGDHMFNGFSSLTSIRISSTVTRIGKYTFASCTSLESLEIPTSVQILDDRAFANSKLMTITLTGVMHFGAEVFYGCSNLVTINYGRAFPPSYSIRDEGVFGLIDDPNVHLPGNYMGSSFIGYDMSYASNIYLDLDDGPMSITCGDSKYEYNVMEMMLTISYQGSDAIGDVTWYSSDDEDILPWAQLPCVEVVVDDSVRSFMPHICFQMSELVSVTLGSNLREIPYSAFGSCTYLESVTIPPSVCSIGESAFGLCSSLTELIVPDSVVSIGIDAFQGCEFLETLVLPRFIEKIPDNMCIGCGSLTSLTIPDRVWYIGNSAFEDCLQITAISIPDSVEIIGDCAFKNIMLQNMKLPNSVRYIGDSAFDGSMMVDIEMGPGIDYIGSQAFGSGPLDILTYHDIYAPAGSTPWFDAPASIKVPKNYKSGTFFGVNVEPSLEETAWEGKYRGLVYWFDVETGALNISGNWNDIVYDQGADLHTNLGKPAWHRYAGEITRIEIEDGITSIVRNMFVSYPELVSVSIPDSVMDIEDGAFSDMEKLEYVEYYGVSDPRSDLNTRDVFSSCDLLTKITVPLDYDSDKFCGVPVEKVLPRRNPADPSTSSEAEPDGPQDIAVIVGASAGAVAVGGAAGAVAFRRSKNKRCCGNGQVEAEPELSLGDSSSDEEEKRKKKKKQKQQDENASECKDEFELKDEQDKEDVSETAGKSQNPGEESPRLLE